MGGTTGDPEQPSIYHVPCGGTTNLSLGANALDASQNAIAKAAATLLAGKQFLEASKEHDVPLETKAGLQRAAIELFNESVRLVLHFDRAK